VNAAAGVGVSFVSAVAINGGFFLQHQGSATAPALSLRRPLASLRALFFTPRWLAGWLGGIAGWGLYICALALAPLSLVQAASAGGVVVLAALTWASGQRLTARERLGTAAAVAGLFLLGASLGTVAPAAAVASQAVFAWIALLVVAAALAAGPAAPYLRPGAGLGVAAGLLYAAGDVATKGAFAPGGTAWLVPLLLACHLGGFVTLQLGFQRGTALATAGPATLLLSGVPIVAGLSLFHDGVPTGVLGAVRLASFAAVVAGAVLLAGASAEPAAVTPSPDTRTPVPPT